MEIYEQILKDREEGARRLVDEYRERLQSAAVMLCGDAHTAEDLVFRAFEQAINRIGDFRPTGSFYYWIYTILLNFWRMDQRKRQVRHELMPKDELPEVPDGKPDPLQQMMFAGTAEAVRAAVQKLPDEFREVVVLRYFEEMSTPEIAKVVGIPPGTVRSRLHYAKDALYAMLSSTELSPDFTARLIKATRRRGSWFSRSRLIASLVIALALTAVAFGSGLVIAQVAGGNGAAGAPAVTADNSGIWKVASSSPVLSLAEDAVDKSIQDGLKFLLTQQKPNGAFHGQYGDSAAIPALAGMAMLSHGHLPTDEKFGEPLLKCLDYVLSTADLSDNANFKGYMGNPGNGRMYAHSIATLFLAEMSGMVDEERQAKIDRLLPLAARVIVDAQNQRKDAQHMGGWRYMPNSNDSDLSCSGWALMALRSAKMNGADVPQEAIEKAVLYIKRSQRADGAFSYQGNGGNAGETLSGAAILCLELCGRHLDPVSLKGQEFVNKVYRRVIPNHGQSFYALYYTAQGLFQLGGETWKEFQDWMYETWLKRQGQDGSWRGPGDQGCAAYSTAMTVLSFTVPYRMLPIYQRDETVDPEDDEEAETKGKEKKS